MSKIQIGCEHYAWVMAGCVEPEEPYYNKIDHIIRVVGRAGFKGFEPIDKFLYSFYDIDRLKDCLDASGLKLASVALLDDWLHPQETGQERQDADKLIDFLAQAFPETVMMLVQMPTSREDAHLKERQDNLISCVNTISRRAGDKGIRCSYHPNSPDSSIWRTTDDYTRLLPLLDTEAVGWTPDVGHIGAGSMDPVKLMRDYRELINHVHYKDMSQDTSWALMGEGIFDFKTITCDLVDTDYQGWIIVEDECERAVDNPDGVTMECGEYSRQTLEPLVYYQGISG